VKTAISTELELLKNLDPDTIETYVSYADLFPDTQDETDLSSGLVKIFPLFFQDFSYKILETDVQEDTASAMVRIETIDAQALAKDFSKSLIKKEIFDSANSDSTEYTLEDYYLLLKNLLEDNQYKTVENNCKFILQKKNDAWAVKHSNDLDNQLTGGFASYLADSGLFTPEEVTAIYFDAIKEFNNEQMSHYLGLENLFDSEDSFYTTIIQELTTQIVKHFDYQIIGHEKNGQTANVTTEIISYDFKKILGTYEENLDAYLSSSNALADGAEGRLEKSKELLLSSIRENTSAASATISILLVNDGSGWSLQMNDEITETILGGIAEAVSL